MRLQAISVFAGLTAAALQGASIDCGSIASPTSCAVQVNGTMEYVFSNFQLLAANGYSEGDFGISVGTGGGGTGLIEFKKIAGGNGSTFFVNSDETKTFKITYDVIVNAILPGTAVFEPQSIVSFGQTSALNAGFAGVQMILTNPPDGKSCHATLNSLNVTQGNCNVLPDNTTNSMIVGNLGNLSAPPAGPQGQNNASFGSFTNLLSASFTPAGIDDAPPTSGVPEPSTWAMLASGLIAAGLRGRRNNGRN